MKKIFKGIMPALVTPFQADGKTIDEQAARNIIEFQLSQGANGFYVLGGTGEGLAIARKEREIMCEVAIDQIANRAPMICHVASINFEETCALAKHAEKAGADAISAVPPIFFFYDSEDIYNYYKKLASCVSIPVIMYYHPATGRQMSPELCTRLFNEIDNLTGVKWSVNDYFGMMRLKDLTQGEMNIINGPDEMLISGLAAGADAGIGSTYNVMLPEFLELYRLFHEGKVNEARAIQLKINRVINAMFPHEIIPAVKYACGMLGYPVGDATFPMRGYTKEQAAAAERDLRAAGFPLS